MQDSTDFSVTIALSVTSSTINTFEAALSGILHQETPCEKLCLVDNRPDISVEPIMAKFLKLARNLPQAPHYKRTECTKPRDLHDIGFQMVTEKFTPRTPLYMYMEADLYLRSNFLTLIKESFYNQKYTTTYRWNILPPNGDKFLNHKSFIVASQVYVDFLRSDDYNGSNLFELLAKMDAPLPWQKESFIDTYTEQLL